MLSAGCRPGTSHDAAVEPLQFPDAYNGDDVSCVTAVSAIATMETTTAAGNIACMPIMSLPTMKRENANTDYSVGTLNSTCAADGMSRARQLRKFGIWMRGHPLSG